MDFSPIEWQAHEYTQTEKSVDWFWAVGLVAVALAVIAVLLDNFLFAILVVIGTGSLLLFSVRNPRIVTFGISKKGIYMDGTLYPYSTLETFWVEDRLFEDKLIVKSKKPLMPLLIIPIDGLDPDEVHEVMSNFLEEEEQEEPFATRLMERLGF